MGNGDIIIKETQRWSDVVHASKPSTLLKILKIQNKLQFLGSLMNHLFFYLEVIYNVIYMFPIILMIS
jgi:hypothetical protein